MKGKSTKKHAGASAPVRRMLPSVTPLSIKPTLRTDDIVTESIDCGCPSSPVHLNEFSWTRIKGAVRLHGSEGRG